MDADKAQRVYICLNELVSISEILQKLDSYDPGYVTAKTKLTKLLSKPEYQEMKEWLRMK